MSMREDVSKFCARIGADPLLVQGAGGNVSWKDADALWIKASGTWLKNALEQDIFVPVGLPDLQTALSQGRFDSTPKVLSGTSLRPSIETVLHALLPQRVVVHIHAVDMLAWLVRPEPWGALQSRLPARWYPCFVPYRKPGAELAKVIQEAVLTQPRTQLICMGNHGMVAAADSLGEVEDILTDVIGALRVMPQPLAGREHLASIWITDQRILRPVADPMVQSLDLTAAGLARMSDAWALYPDHVVFLGDRPIRHASVEAAIERCLADPMFGEDQPHFIQNTGVFAFGTLTAGRMAQLRCYADVLLRQSTSQRLQALSLDDIAELLNWDAERYRQQLNLER